MEEVRFKKQYIMYMQFYKTQTNSEWEKIHHWSWQTSHPSPRALNVGPSSPPCDLKETPLHPEQTEKENWVVPEQECLPWNYMHPLLWFCKWKTSKWAAMLVRACSRWKNGLQRCPHPSPQNLWIQNLSWQMGLCKCHPGWGLWNKYPGLYRWTLSP